MSNNNRQVALDTETTGLKYKDGHKITEIGCVEIINRKLTGKEFHSYVNPEREVSEKAKEITGLDYDFLKDKPLFSQIALEFVNFVQSSQIIIHNAPFDVGFINHELQLIGIKNNLENIGSNIIDTLVEARKLHPSQRNNLNALCKRYKIDYSHRDLHGALLDANLLAKLYLAMTKGQTVMNLSNFHCTDYLNSNYEETHDNNLSGHNSAALTSHVYKPKKLNVIYADPKEMQLHDQFLQLLKEKA